MTRAHSIIAAANPSWRSRLAMLVAGAFMVVAMACTDAAAPTEPGSPLAAKGGAKGKPQPPYVPPEPSPVPSGNALAGATFYANPANHAQRQADEWRANRPADSEQLDKIATRPQAKWIGSWLSDPTYEISTTLTAATAQGQLAVFVAYNIPRLNCGSGGAVSADAYKAWIDRFAAAIVTTAVVIVEPDALAGMGCLSSADQQQRFDLIRHAVLALRARQAVVVYVDAGHAAWQSAVTMAARLTSAGVDHAHGFALNVSNFVSTEANTLYGADISGRVGGKHFVIDTSRNGQGPTPDYQWCNPDGRGLGKSPTTVTASPLVDAYIWIKPPGESDGTCNGGPRAGAWWADYALGLAERSAL